MVNKKVKFYYKIIFTVNNPSNIELNLGKTVKYAAWQLEKGASSGIEHLQGIIIFMRSVRLNHVKDVIGNGEGVHIEQIFAKDINDAKNYVIKEDTRIDGPWFFGNIKNSIYYQKKDKELKDLQYLLDTGISEKKLIYDYPYLYNKYRRYRGDYYRVKESYKTEKRKFSVYCGASGTGKTTKAKSESSSFYFKPKGKWLDNNYLEQETIILDEIDKLGLPFVDLLKMIDGDKISFNTKGGFKTISNKTKNIIATSNLQIDKWYISLTEIEKIALYRRIDELLLFFWKIKKGKKKEVAIENKTIEIKDIVNNFVQNNLNMTINYNSSQNCHNSECKCNCNNK